MYETYNFLNQKINSPISSDLLFENYKKILSILYPIIPHFVSECFEDLKIDQNIKWPLVDKKLLVSEETNIVIQINGKKRSIINCKKGITEEILIKNIKKDIKINKFLENKKIIRSIFVKNKLINLITK
tara:strand:- start:171 stop:557 length:387 start_codon:yes stop_codon:yes gene_type:complete